MPNITLDYSSDISILHGRKILDLINSVVIESAIFEACDIKTRGCAFEDYLIGEGADRQRFAHLKVSMMPREQGVEAALADRLLGQLAQYINALEGVKVQVCVEIIHVNASSYRKRAV